MKKYFNIIAFTFLVNMITMLVTTFVTFVLPKKIGVAEYGYVQLYLFYANYTGFLHFGWADGVYLKYGGTYYDQIDKSVFSGQFWLYFVAELLIGCMVCIAGTVIGFSWEKQVVFSFTGILICVYLPRTLLQYILQATNRIRAYAIILVADRLIYLAMICFSISSSLSGFQNILLADIAAKTGSFLIALYYCRRVVFAIPDSMIRVIKEARDNISIGMKLMFANVASMLIIGIIRLAIEDKWDIETFGKISLTMSVSSLFMILINAVAMVMFPVLRRSDPDKLSDIYMNIRMMLIFPMLGMLVFYYPVENILSGWLPQYADSLQYMAILFPMCLFECKMSLLVSTYMKTLRKEKWLMQVNFVTLAISVFLTFFNVYVLQSLDFTILSVVVLLGFRSVAAELLLSRELHRSMYQINLEEIALSCVFMAANWFVQGYKGVLIYLTCYLFYLIGHRKDIRFWIKRS